MKAKKLKPKKIADQVILITGASSGIGLATARMAVRRGADVVISSRNEDELRRLEDKWTKEGYSVLAVPADVSKYEDMENLRDRALEKFGRIDTWVNNAGLSIYGPILAIPEEEERQLFDINFWGVRHGSRVAIPCLCASGGGVLINIGSEVSGRSVPVQGMYAASKHAVKAYTDALRMECETEEMPVSVCLVRPTAIDTPFTEHAVNRLVEGEPSLPTPIYHPDVVADAILNCAEHPQRDIYVGGSSRLFDVLDTVFPRFTDILMEYVMEDKLTQGTLREHKTEHESLWSAPEGEGRMQGDHPGKVKQRSLYTSAVQHPWRTMAIAGAAAVALGGLAKAFSTQQPRG